MTNLANAPMEEVRAGGYACGAWLFFREPIVAMLAAKAGYDFVCIDNQHGVQGTEAIAAMIEAVARVGVAAFARAPSTDPAAIGRLLDAGAVAIILPMIGTAAQCRAGISACYYAPRGTRSNGAIGAAALYGTSYLQQANQTVAAIPMIETREGFENLEEILQVDGVDAILVGPSDLRLSLNLVGSENDAAFEAVLIEIAGTCIARHVVPGIYATPQNVARRLAMGYRLVSVATDWDHITSGLESDLRTFEDAVSSIGK